MRKNIAVYLRYYNVQRLHTANGEQSPINYENSLKKVSGWLDQYNNRIEYKDGTKKLLHFRNKAVKNSSGKTEFIFFTAKQTDYTFFTAEDI